MGARVLAAVVLGAGAIAVAGTIAIAGADRGGDDHARVLLHDAFAGGRLDRRVWATCHWWAHGGCTIASNHELEWYLPGQVRVRGGALRLRADRRGVTGSDGRRYPFVSGMVSSGPRSESGPAGFTFRYGRAEWTVRVPSGRGLWPGLWMLPASRRSLPEIDVMEVVGQRPATVEMHLHYRGRDGREHAPGGTYTSPSLTAGRHRFAVDWRPGRLRWFIDGVERFRITGRAVPSEPMYLLANLAVGGDWPGPPDASTRFPSTFAIDDVRVTR